MQKSFMYYSGNLLLLLSVIFFLVVFGPLLKIFLFPPTLQVTKALHGYYITIPKISAQAPLILNVDPWNESEYSSSLKKGVAVAHGSVLPGERGKIYLFAHSSGMPWELTRYNTVFLRLSELRQGDLVILSHESEEYRYKAESFEEVWPDQVEAVTSKEGDILILQTCTPIGTSLKRLLVIAKRI